MNTIAYAAIWTGRRSRVEFPLFYKSRAGFISAALVASTLTGIAGANAGGGAGAGAAQSTSDSRPAADLIIRHARIWTVNPAQPQAEAVAVLNGRIAAVGSDAAVLAWRGPDTRVVDAAGK